VLRGIKWVGHAERIEMGNREMKYFYREEQPSERMTAQSIRHWEQPTREKSKVILVVNYVIKRLAMKTYAGAEVYHRHS
jgi:hypothetical protein